MYRYRFVCLPWWSREMCSPRKPIWFAGSHPTEINVFFSELKSRKHIFSGKNFNYGYWVWRISGSLKNLKPKEIVIWARFTSMYYFHSNKMALDTFDLSPTFLSRIGNNSKNQLSVAAMSLHSMIFLNLFKWRKYILVY